MKPSTSHVLGLLATVGVITAAVFIGVDSAKVQKGIVLAGTMQAEKIRPFLPPQSQASSLAVPEIGKPIAAVLVTYCKHAIALALTDSSGYVHNQPLEGLTQGIIDDLLTEVPGERVFNYIVPCGATDGYPL